MKGDKKDVGLIDDAILYLSNALAAENHALMSYIETKDEQWLSIAVLIRRNRSKLLYELVEENNGEAYCFSKHILICAGALKELSNRKLEEGKGGIAKYLLQEASDYEALFKLVNNHGGNK